MARSSRRGLTRGCVCQAGVVTPETWSRFVDDASPLPDGDARVERRASPAVGARVVRDTDLPRLRGYRGDVRVVVSGGAGQLAGPVRFCDQQGLELTSLDVTLRDLDDPAGNARRVVAAVDAARAEGLLLDDTAVHVGVAGGPSYSWLGAADELAAAEHALLLPLGALTEPEVEAWIDAALDRELPFALSGGTPEQAVAAVRTTARLWGDADDLDRARRWCLSWSTPDVDGALDHLQALD